MVFARRAGSCMSVFVLGELPGHGGSTLQTDTGRLHEPRGIRSPVRARKLRQPLQQTAVPQRMGVLDWPRSLQQRQREPTAKLWHHLPSERLRMPVSRPFVVAEGEEQCLVQGQDPRDTNMAHPGLWVESRLSLGSQQHRRTPSGKEGRHATSLPRHSLVPAMKSGISFGKNA